MVEELSTSGGMAAWALPAGALLLLRLVLALLLSVAVSSSSAGFLRPFFAAAYMYDDGAATFPTPALPTMMAQQWRRHLLTTTCTSCPAGKFDDSGTCAIW